MDQLLTETLQNVKNAARLYGLLSYQQRQSVLITFSQLLQQQEVKILEENQYDLAKLSSSDPKYDRLLLNSERLAAIRRTIKNIAQLPDPLNQILETYQHQQGMKLVKISVPLGVVAIIYESRPNVTIDSFVLSFMAGNACVLKGGREADNSNKLFVKLIHAALTKHNITTDGVVLLPALREMVTQLCHAYGLVDVIIPRGGNSLIKEVRENAKVPVIETGAGVVHIYFDKAGDIKIGNKVLTNAKTRRVSVCNAVDCLIIHEQRLADLPQLVNDLKSKHVEIYADQQSFNTLTDIYPHQLLHHANAENYGMEYLSLKLAIKTVTSFTEALIHIQSYSSGHSEAIITDDEQTRDQFIQQIDAAAVYVNTSTAFTDGGEFGMSAEIGISTQKLHVRGPFSMQHLTTMKWLIYGEGQVRQ